MDAAQLDLLLADAPLLADGGMGTSLIARGAPVGACLEASNGDDPAAVETVHRGFVAAGAHLILTNTFGANRFRLGSHGLADRMNELNRAGVALARRAGARIVGGSMGPLGVRLAPYGRVGVEDAQDAYAEQAAALMGAGADLLVLETQTDLREMEQAILGARRASADTAILVSATFTRDDRTLLGESPAQVAARLDQLGADVIGVNCGEGPAQVLRVIRAMRPYAGGRTLMARPNAGGPTEVGGRFVYPATPVYVAEHALACVAEGASIVGGCCGTGPEHTAAIAGALRSGAGGARVEVADLGGALDEPAALPSTTARATALGARLAEAAFVIAVEVEPPRSFNAARLVAAAGTLRDAGADVIDVADSPMAKMRMSAWAACRLVEEQVGVETVLHFPTRGRNLLRLQGDLLGAHALGIRNLFVCVGDPVTIGEYPHGSNDLDVTATGLLALISEGFNAGRDRSGSSIGEPTSFFVGAAVAPSSPDLERECRLLKRKVDAGARFLLSQPLYEVAELGRLRDTYERVTGEPLAVPVLAGVLPLVTERHAAFLHNEVPGIVIPDAARARLASAGEAATRVGVAMAAELARELRAAGAAGIYVMPQFGRYDLAAEVVEAARTP
ncbi:MAG: bifunctional homocysteine S-methyltransferase/methylenetetrahydrofolate reductase [Actinomycetota bacterium]